ncbi:MAG: hypothetical protein IPJ65_19210 [Archangiaceae bacterium]|nr:hypothetical protein [Archangiaceae bacterium]
MKTTLMPLFLLALSAPAFAQYTPSAGVNAPTVTAREEYKDDRTGETRSRTVVRPAAKDGYGNAQGNQYDLAVDGAFEGQTVAVLQLYVDGQFDFAAPKAALKEKGFNVVRWLREPPPAKELSAALEKSNQLWVIADCYGRHLGEAHLAAIKKFFDAGHGVYIWGDNEPCYDDANAVGQALLGVKMLGNVPGDQTVGRREGKATAGLIPGHLLTTGLENIYEGITIATIQPNEVLTPLIYGHEGNLVAGFYDRGGKRAVFDGGFTRLYYKWDTAGTGRYVKNAASWLANVERFGDKVSKLAGGAK